MPRECRPYYDQWIKLYSALATVQFFLLCTHPLISPLIEKLNNCDKDKIQTLLEHYQVTAKKLFKYRYKKYKNSLSLLSDDILPTDLNKLSLNFVMKSEKCIMDEINAMDATNINNGSEFVFYEACSLIILGTQIVLLFAVLLLGLNFMHDMVKYQVSYLTFVFIIGALGRSVYFLQTLMR